MIENLIDYIENEIRVKNKQLEEIENNKLRGLEDVSNYTCGQIDGLEIILEYIKEEYNDAQFGCRN
jgi:sugar-specific transcriptional regulator TrmB